MSDDQEHKIKKNLIEELESLHKALGSATENPRALDAGAGARECTDEYAIPILVDVIRCVSADMADGDIKDNRTNIDQNIDPVSTIYQQALTPREELSDRKFDISTIPTLYPEQYEQNSRIDELVDELVAEYLPALEHRLRTKLRQRFATQNKTH
ncbi:MAG: hypothetical protein P1U80_11785 [Pseudomonadales bacterium]|nr:hypothetical protein [Pseudomonadales bacterium]